MQVTEESIATACNLPIDDEMWFKNKLITGGDVNQFLKPEHRDLNWAKGIPRDWIVDEWMDSLLMLKRYIACEGCYSTMFLFHLCFLLHLSGIKRMSLPYYFLRYLNSMAMKIQENPNTPPHGIYHQGFIKILIKSELGKLQRTWDTFLIQSGFEKEVHHPITQLHDKIVEPNQEASPSVNQPVIPRKGKRESCLNISNDPMEDTPTILQ
jgi:hypothetical protein